MQDPISNIISADSRLQHLFEGWNCRAMSDDLLAQLRSIGLPCVLGGTWLGCCPKHPKANFGSLFRQRPVICSVSLTPQWAELEEGWVWESQNPTSHVNDNGYPLKLSVCGNCPPCPFHSLLGTWDHSFHDHVQLLGPVAMAFFFPVWTVQRSSPNISRSWQLSCCSPERYQLLCGALWRDLHRGTAEE